MGMPIKRQRSIGCADASVLGGRMKSVELFAGAGGLALGIEHAGFHHHTVVERNRHCCETIRENQRRNFAPLDGWRLHSGDVRNFDYSAIQEDIDLLAGGPPCQPFSIGGKHKGPLDRRDMFPEMVRAVRELRPRAIIVENVRGLLRTSFSKYFEYIILQLQYPELISKADENWNDHLSRLERHHTKGLDKGLHYNIVFRPLNAVNYGVPQKRERVIIVGFRADLGVEWSFPNPTHSQDSLLADQWITGEYWERHAISKRRRPALPSRLVQRVAQLKSERPLSLFQDLPWRTVRDTIYDLPDPQTGDCTGVSNHQLRLGARSYAGHTGSPFDEPAKTLKAGDHGVPGGENTLVKPDGSLRYFTVRECARIQTFPDEYVLSGAWTESMRQLGNAVPVLLAQTIASGIHTQLSQM
jgi:DNA (cytosine-5)-methyltransferase 1